MYAITLAAAAIIWPFIVNCVADKYGTDVSARFLERLGHIPSTGKALTRENLEEWLRSPANGQFRRPYAYFIMPLDFVYICLVGGFFVWGSLWLAAALTWPRPATWPFCVLVCILPVVYVVSDLVEDALIARIVPRQDVTNTEFKVMRWATKIKMVCFGAAAVQTFVLGVCAVFWSAA